MRISSMVRGMVIGGLMLVYGYLMRQPGASLTITLLVAAGLQAGVLILRRVVPRDQLPMVMYIFELLVDAATVILFAMGVFGGLLRLGADI
jgi:hypothetical protein